MNPMIEEIARMMCEIHEVDAEEKIICDCCGKEVPLWHAYAEPAIDTIEAAERLGYRLVKFQ